MGTSQDIRVTGYKLYTDNGLPGNSYLIYDGTDNTELMRYEHKSLSTGTYYYYSLQVLNFNGPSEMSSLAVRPACEIP